jgi:hypothetical protein
MDGETSIGPRFNIIRKRRGFTIKIITPGNSAQNNSNKRLRKKFIIKSRYNRIEACFLIDIWPKTIKTTGYISNKTLVKRLGWLTPFKTLKGYKPKFAYLKNYNTKIYALDYYIPKSWKNNSRAFIRYLVSYDLTNIFRI